MIPIGFSYKTPNLAMKNNFFAKIFNPKKVEEERKAMLNKLCKAMDEDNLCAAKEIIENNKISLKDFENAFAHKYCFFSYPTYETISEQYIVALLKGENPDIKEYNHRIKQEKTHEDLLAAMIEDNIDKAKKILKENNVSLESLSTFCEDRNRSMLRTLTSEYVFSFLEGKNPDIEDYARRIELKRELMEAIEISDLIAVDQCLAKSKDIDRDFDMWKAWSSAAPESKIEKYLLTRTDSSFIRKLHEEERAKQEKEREENDLLARREEALQIELQTAI